MKKIVSLVLILSLMCSMVSMFSIVSFSAAKDDAWTCEDCVRYAKARFREIWGFDLHPAYSESADGYYYNASSNGDIVSSTPQTGALAIWIGHVAIVESVSGSYVTYSEGGFDKHFNQETRNTSNMSKTNQPFLGYVYVKGTSIATVKPGKPDLWTESALIRVGTDFTIHHWAENAQSYLLEVYKDDNLVTTSSHYVATYVANYRETGEYKIVVTANNQNGSSESSSLIIYIFDTVPNKPDLWCKPTSIPKGNDFVIHHWAEFANSYSLRSYKDNKLIEESFHYVPTYTTRYEEVGEYKIVVSAFNDLGEGDCSEIFITIYDPNQTFNIKYNANVGSNAPSTQTKKYGESIAISSTEPTRDGYTFLGWSTDKNATEPEYIAGDIYAENKDLTLYAVWKEEIKEFAFEGEIKVFGDSADKITFDFIKAGETEVCHSTTVDGDSLTYEIFGIENGEYTMRVSKNNHVAREYEVVVGTEDIKVDIQLNLIGDINGDGKITITDYTQVLKHVKKISALDGYTFECGDINGDGRIAITDYNKILKHVKKTEFLW